MTFYTLDKSLYAVNREYYFGIYFSMFALKIAEFEVDFLKINK